VATLAFSRGQGVLTAGAESDNDEPYCDVHHNNRLIMNQALNSQDKQPQAKWLQSRDGVQYGPFTSRQLQVMATAGELLPTDFLWKDGMADWIKADSTSLAFPAPADDATVVVEAVAPVDVADDAALADFLSGGGKSQNKWSFAGEQSSAPAPTSPSFPQVDLNTAKVNAKEAVASLKSAGSLVAKAAERTKIATAILPRAYGELGKAAYTEASRREEFSELFKAIDDLMAERRRIHEEATAQPAAETFADKAKRAVSDAASLARTKAIDLQAFRAFAQLGEAIYQQHASDAGPVELVSPIAKAIERRDQLDRDTTALHKASEGSWITPKRILLAASFFIGLGLISNSIDKDKPQRSNSTSTSTRNSSGRKGSASEASLYDQGREQGKLISMNQAAIIRSAPVQIRNEQVATFWFKLVPEDRELAKQNRPDAEFYRGRLDGMLQQWKKERLPVIR
jgi:hypothetical protein